jgi:hypothetical protein
MIESRESGSRRQRRINMSAMNVTASRIVLLKLTPQGRPINEVVNCNGSHSPRSRIAYFFLWRAGDRL